MLGSTFFLVGVLAAAAADPGPSIGLFDSRVVLDASGAVDVSERIRFGAGALIEREIPTRRLLWSGLRAVSRVTLIDATLDGAPVSLRSRSTPRGVLWTPALDPAPEERTLFLRYRADARVFEGPDADLFIWDVTGYGREIPIETTRLSFPKPASVKTLNYSVLTGKPGALIDVDRRNEDKSEMLWFRDRPLVPGEGVRLILRLPKGAVRAGPPRTAGRTLRDNLHAALGFFGAATLALFVFFKHRALNRDPDPLARPDGPGADLSYAAARYLVNGGRYSGRVLQAGLAGLVAKRWLSEAREEEGRWTFARGETDGDVLTLDERALGDALLRGKRGATLAGTGAFEAAIDEHARALEGLWSPRLRARAWIPWACGVAWSAGIVSAMRAAAALFEPVAIPTAGTLAAGALCAAGGAVLVGVWTLTYRTWRAASLPAPDGKTRMIPLLAAIALGFLSFGLVTAAAGAFQSAVGDLAPAALLAGFCLLFVNWAAFYALRGPTPGGFDALRRARLLVKRREERTFSAILAATEPLARAVDGRV